MTFSHSLGQESPNAGAAEHVRSAPRTSRSQQRQFCTYPVFISPVLNHNLPLSLVVPFRVFGLLVTAEKNAQAETPSTAVVLESLLPTDRYLVIPVFRVNVDLTPPQG